MYHEELGHLFNLSRPKLTMKPLDLVKLIAGTAITYGAYKTIQLYIRRRKYQHIPGPGTSG